MPSQAARERLCQLLLERLRSLVALDSSRRATTQYQPAGTQYQGSGLDETSVQPVNADTGGWKLFKPVPAKRTVHLVQQAPTGPRQDAPPVRRDATSLVLGATAVHKATAADPVRLRAQVPQATPRAVEHRAAAPARAASESTSTDWFLGTLLVLLGLAACALLLLAVAEVEGVDKVLAGFGSRVRSRGLGTSRIALGGDGARSGTRRREIRYRD